MHAGARTPKSIIYEQRRYDSTQYLTDYNHIVLEWTLFGFDFYSPEDFGENFLKSCFVIDTANVKSLDWPLEIFLAPQAEAESDQGSYLGAQLFSDGFGDYMIVMLEIRYWWLHFGFELQTQSVPIPEPLNG